MFQVPVDILNGVDRAKAHSIMLNEETHASNGRVPFYRAELFLNQSEIDRLNELFSDLEYQFGKPHFVEVKEPPLIQPIYVPAPAVPAYNPLPARSTRGLVPSSTTISRLSSAGGKSQGGKAAKMSTASAVPKAEPIVKAEPVVAPPTTQPTPRAGPVAEAVVPMIPMNKAKIQQVISEAFSELMADPEYMCLLEDNLPQDSFPSPPISLTTVKDRILSLKYLDHFQFMDDLIAVSMHWLQGPPPPNPILPQYMAALKLLRRGTELLMSHVGHIGNEDYYTGPDVAAAIKEEVKRESSTTATTTHSPSYARKVRRTDSTASAGGQRRAASSGSSELKSIEEQVTMLTQHVLGLQKAKGPPQQRQSAPADSRPLSTDEIAKLESDLMRLTPDDIDHIVTSLLKDEPSVRVDDESYELDVGALPPAKQRNLRRFVTRRLNTTDPSHEAAKLKQILKADELAKASEEMAERLLAGPAYAPSLSAAIVPTEPQQSPEEIEAERQRQFREHQRDEEARRLWRLAHGDDDDSMDLED